MKERILILVISLLPVLANAGDSGSQIAWTPGALNFVKNGDAGKGQILADSCKACHGQRGEGLPAENRDGEIIPTVPALAGQVANYTYKQLRDYFNDDRSNESMTGIAKSLSEQDAADVAAWFASISLPKSANDDKIVSAAEKMVEAGDGKRILPPCFVCHGANGQGEKMDIPSLAGQQADYFARTLLAYKNGQRHNDIYSRMRLIAKQLSESEIKALSTYYQQLR
ncbi:c-type cytochrome [Methyloglobulus sp.]|uniref:c-type cytochrome n=1 Tax=Methyloglobulus sp. TaxID=2518622 RepID=UPI0032B7D651